MCKEIVDKTEKIVKQFNKLFKRIGIERQVVFVDSTHISLSGTILHQDEAALLLQVFKDLFGV